MKFYMCVTWLCIVAVASSPIEDGRWNPKKYGNDGKYVHRNEGRYVHIPNPYIHNDNPYLHDDNPSKPYVHENNPYARAHEPYEAAESQDTYRLVQQKPDTSLPYYKEGYYKNNGIKIINQQKHTNEDKYDFNFETENKIRAKEEAVLKNPNSIDSGIATKGFYEYIGPDGFMYRVDYTADEHGFRPTVRRLETPYSGKWVLEKSKKL